jgi:hypothetical protein
VGLVIAVIIIKWISSSNKKINETSKSYDLLKRR